MPTPTSVRRIIPAKKRNFGRISDEFPVPDLTQIQTRSYERFLQADLPVDKRGDAGLEGVFREIFPIESYDKTLKLEYLHYDLGKPRYDPDECRQLRLTYGRPLHVWLRLNKGETTLEESVYLGDMPIMIGGGEFIINGAERVVVSQLHRSPGVDFVVEIESSDKKLHACRVIPERGSWIELQVTKKDTLGVRIDQSGKFSSMTLLACDEPEVFERRGHPPGLLRGRGNRLGRSQGGRQARGRDRLRRRRRPQYRRGLDRQRHDDFQSLGASPGRRRQPGHDPGPQGFPRPADPPVASGRPDHRSRKRALADLPAAAAGQSPATGKGPRALSREVFRYQPLPPGQGRPVPDQPQVQSRHPGRPDDPRPRRLRQRHPLHPQPAAAARGTSTTSTTWATAGCARSTSWPPTSCARGSSSCAAPSRSG